MNVKDAVGQQRGDLAGNATRQDGISSIFEMPESNGSTAAPARPDRASATLGKGRSVIVVSRGLTLDSFIKTLQEALAKARRAKTYGLQLDAFLKMLRDMGQR